MPLQVLASPATVASRVGAPATLPRLLPGGGAIEPLEALVRIKRGMEEFVSQQAGRTRDQPS